MASRMNVKLLTHTPAPEQIVAQAAKLCYSAAGVDAIAEKLTPESVSKFLRTLADQGHYSAFEHASFTFGAEGISRSLTHQLVRHRLASYSQQSQRYVGMSELPSGAVIPDSIPNTAEKPLREKFEKMLEAIGGLYEEMRQAGVPAEDARYILPNASPTKIVITMNARELLHFFNLRCCLRAQWEIRDLADRMLDLARPTAPALFAHAGPGCVAGACPEGKMTCGKLAEVRERYRKAAAGSL